MAFVRPALGQIGRRRTRTALPRDCGRATGSLLPGGGRAPAVAASESLAAAQPVSVTSSLGESLLPDSCILDPPCYSDGRRCQLWVASALPGKIVNSLYHCCPPVRICALIWDSTASLVTRRKAGREMYAMRKTPGFTASIAALIVSLPATGIAHTAFANSLRLGHPQRTAMWPPDDGIATVTSGMAPPSI